jgi:hypothetical protein
MRALPGMQSTFGDLVVISGVFVYCCISLNFHTFGKTLQS